MINIVEVAQVAGVVILSFTSIGGWVYTLRKNGKSEGIAEQKQIDTNSRINDLPCNADPAYERRAGEVIASMKHFSERMRAVEGSVKDVHGRIDDILQKGSNS